MEMSVAVIGAGNGGTAIAGYLASVGANVRLCDLFPEYLEGIRAAGGIDLTLEGVTSHQSLDLITSDVVQAIQGVNLIMVVTPSFTHKMIAQACCGALADGQVVVLNPGRTWGALEFLNTVRAGGGPWGYHHCGGPDVDILLPQDRALIGRNLRGKESGGPGGLTRRSDGPSDRIA